MKTPITPAEVIAQILVYTKNNPNSPDAVNLLNAWTRDIYHFVHAAPPTKVNIQMPPVQPPRIDPDATLAMRIENAESDLVILENRIDGLIATFKESNAHVEQAHAVGMRAMIERAEKAEQRCTELENSVSMHAHAMESMKQRAENAEKKRELYLARIKECIGISEVTSIARESLEFVNARLRHVLSLTNQT